MRIIRAAFATDKNSKEDKDKSSKEKDKASILSPKGTTRATSLAPP